MSQNKKMKIIFAGTPEFAAVILKALIDSPYEIVAVYTQPDRPSGRGLKLTLSPVKALALEHHTPVCQPASLKNEAEQAVLSRFNADIMVVAAYGLLLPAAVLAIPPLGCINIHPSLLPRWRGAAPIQRTIHAGDTETGVAIMQMDAGLDTGPILLQRHYILAKDETTQTLHDKLAVIGADALLETLTLIEQAKVIPQPQDNAFATYANKITKEEALIDWMKPAVILSQEIRAFNIWPVSHTTWQQQNCKIWHAKALMEVTKEAPGTIIRASKEGVDIATGEGVLRLLHIQLAGGKALSVANFYNAHHDKLLPGTAFN